MFKRELDLSHYHESFFLFGPRQTGKTYLINHTLKPDLYIDLLKQQEFLRYAKDVSLLSKEIPALVSQKILVVIDEIQRCPDLLNEVQVIIDSQKPVQFILTGSSARKLKGKGSNLLGGRATELHLHPLTVEEWGETFDLTTALHFGCLPRIAAETNPKTRNRLLRSYVEIYLKEEIQQEALTRNVPAFARFLELAGFENGNILNFSKIAQNVGIHANTVREYFQILCDTLIGFFLYPYKQSHRQRLVSHPKFYFFDTGVTAALRNELSAEIVAGTPPYGRAFEHWVILETQRLLDYRERDSRLSFFRTNDGAEVDLILERGKEVWAIEIKASEAPRSADLGGLKSFLSDHKVNRAVCVCLTPRPCTSDTIEFLPWREFLKQL